VGKINNCSSEHIFGWWTSTKRYIQYEVARDYLAIPATSASSERVFSSAKQLVTEQLNRLDEDTIEIVEFLNVGLIIMIGLIMNIILILTHPVRDKF
jgi:hypothetical protein